MLTVRAPRLLGFVVGIWAGYFGQTLLNNAQEPTPPDGIIGALLGGITGAIVAHVVVKLRGRA